MTSAIDRAVDTDVVPEFPLPRPDGCPFDPPTQLRELQERGPIHRVRLADGSTPWLVTRHADQRAVLRDPGVGADPHHPGFPRNAPLKGSTLSFMHLDDPEHGRLRRMVSAPFTAKKVQALRPLVQRIVDGLLDQLAAGPKPADLVEAFALPVPSMVVCHLLGVPYDRHEHFQRCSSVYISRGSTPEQRTAAIGELAAVLRDLVAVKAAQPADDLLSAVAGHVAAGELTPEQGTELAVLLLVGGYETTANMISLGVLALLRHPDQLRLVRDAEDLATVTRAVDELLRYLSITHRGRRRVALRDLEVAGTLVRAGEGLVIPLEIGNRDPDVFPDPLVLDVTKGLRDHLAFGAGPHQCLGGSLAVLELEVAYRSLLRRFPDLALAVDFDDIPFKHDAFVYGVHELPVTW